MKRDYKIIIVATLFPLWFYGLGYCMCKIELEKQQKINEQLRIEYNELKKSYEELEEYVNCG